jgi:amino acid adenylation domain-containing protein
MEGNMQEVGIGVSVAVGREPSSSCDRLIQELYEEQVRRGPQALAVVCEGGRLTYAQLNCRANQLARHLLSRGVGPDRLVGLYLERSPELVVGILGVLKAGGAFVPMDAAYPVQRLAYMLQDAAPQVVLTQERLRSRLPETAAEVIELDSAWSEIGQGDDSDLDPHSQQLSASHLAYVIYTSGSTGEPKGVAAEHRGMVNRILAQESIEPFAPDEICCQKTSIGFVDAIFEILGPLCYGRPLVLAPAAASQDLLQLAALVEKEGITRLVSVPSLAQSLLESERAMRCLRGLRSWTLSGEELRADLLRNLQQRLPECNFINLYGSSEVAADVSCYQSKVFEGHKVPIGKPIANTQLYVLDASLQPVPVGVVGEIYVGGAGVARGYLNRPELTRERFLYNPFEPSSRLYKSGDLGRWRADGQLEYVGRNDQQVKIRGFRIELGEIEAHLARYEKVKSVVVIAREDVPGEKNLVAYLTRREGCELSGQELRLYLQGRVPQYLVPSAFVVLEGFPLTPGGKLDRRALPATEHSADERRPYEAPEGEIEPLLATIWQELLKVERVGRHDNFFELGGHSLLAARVVARIHERLEAELPIKIIFDSPTVQQLAHQVEMERALLSSRESVRTNRIEREFRDEINEMDDAAVFAQLARMEAELGNEDPEVS